MTLLFVWSVRAQNKSVIPTAVQVRMMTEGTITYKLTSPGASKEESDLLSGSTYILSLKGSKVRTDFSNALGLSTTIYSSLTHSGALLHDYGQEKLLVKMTKEDFEDLNGQYRNLSYFLTTDTATIAGYLCKKAIGKTATGDTLLVWFSPDLLPQNKEYSYRFNPIPGLPLQYESKMGNQKVVFQAVRVSLDPVPGVKFDVPKTGYREMNYAETKKTQW
jgi:GLPGLI family protein